MSKVLNGPSTLFVESVPTPIGTIALVTDEHDLVRALDWDDHLPRLHRLLRMHYGTAVETSVAAASRDTVDGEVHLHERTGASQARDVLRRYFDGDITAIDEVAVATGGTSFQRDVWAALRRVPAGQTTSYGALAARIERPRAVRAVGHANGSNPIGIIVPCHRVIGASGQLTGYAGGIERKRWLLEHEARHVAHAASRALAFA